jgi:lysylphosphatidylglycerol synthetase-like protein (DUF2156 family)
MSFWRSLLQTIAKNPISLFAVICVACTAAWLGYMSYRLLAVVESTEWCAKAIQAERITPGNTFVGLIGCIDILKIQLGGVVNGFYIALTAFAFSLIVLVVVVVAGARANFKLGKEGVEGSVSREDMAATAVAGAAVDKAAEITGEIRP